MPGIMAVMDQKDKHAVGFLVQAVLRTTDFPQLLDTVIDVPVVQVVLTVTCAVFGVRLRSRRCGFSGR